MSDTDIDFLELWDSQDTAIVAANGGDSMKLRARIQGTDSRDAAYARLMEEIQDVLNIGGDRPIVADKASLKPVGPKIWHCDVEYISPTTDTSAASAPKIVGESTFEFDTTGGQTKIYAAQKQARYGPAIQRNAGLAINVSNGKVNGVDVVIPSLSFTVHQRVEGQTITPAWLMGATLLTGTVNKGTYFGFAEGTVLFLGCSGQQPTAFVENGQEVKGDREITYNFAVSPNLEDLEFEPPPGVEGEKITVKKKEGWDFLWTEFRDVKKDGQVQSELISVYIASVYRKASLQALGVNNPFSSHPVIG
ncbi:MAG: hypothetical protein AAF958_19070 [Planctomycetota bacterium]